MNNFMFLEAVDDIGTSIPNFLPTMFDQIPSIPPLLAVLHPSAVTPPNRQMFQPQVRAEHLNVLERLLAE